MFSRGGDLYREVLPVFQVSRPFGVSPFTGELSLSLPLAVYSAGFLASNTALGLFITLQMHNMNRTFTLSVFSLALERFQALIVSTTIVVSVVKAASNGARMSALMKSLKAVDAELARIGVRGSHSSRRCLAVTVTRAVLLLSLPLVGFSFFSTYKSVETIVLEYIMFVPVAVANLVQAQFICLLEMATRRLILAAGKVAQIAASAPYPGRVAKVEALAKAHGSLVSFCRAVGSMYSPQILVILSSIFIITTANLYHVIDKTVKYFSGQKERDFNVLFLISYRLLVRSYEVWTLINSAVYTSDKVKEFTRVLYLKMMEDQTEELSSSKKLGLHVAMKSEVTFTACGFFNLDYTLIHSMLAAATTYLVILIQFGPPSPVPDTIANYTNISIPV